MEVVFLTLADALMIHTNQVALYGGDDGVIDLGMLDSALAQPRVSFGGEMRYADLFEMAAAYLFHIVRNHPFADGNKRTGAMAALVFLDDNGVEIEIIKGELFALTMGVASSEIDKPEIAEFFRARAH